MSSAGRTLLEAFLEEIAPAGGALTGPARIPDLPGLARIESAPPDVQADVVVRAASHPSAQSSFRQSKEHRYQQIGLRHIMARLLPRGLSFSREQACTLLANRGLLSAAQLLDVVERTTATHEWSDGLVVALQALLGDANVRHDAELKSRIEALVKVGDVVPPVPGEPWTDLARSDLQTLDGRARKSVEGLLAHLSTAASIRPAPQWQATARKLVDKAGRARLVGFFSSWVARVTPTGWSQDALVDCSGLPRSAAKNARLLLGMVVASRQGDLLAPSTIAALAAVCFMPVPGLGAYLPRVGYACLDALASLPGDSTALSDLARTLPYPRARAYAAEAVRNGV